MGVSASVQLYRAARNGDVVKMHDAMAKGADVDVVQVRPVLQCGQYAIPWDGSTPALH